MASLKPTLTLAGTAADLGSTLALTVNDDLSITTPQRNVSRISIGDEYNTGAQDALRVASTVTDGPTYVYIKHSGFQGDGTTVSTDKVQLKNANGVMFAQLDPQEFVFFPFYDGGAMTLIAHSSHTTNTITVEYAYWRKA